MLTVENLKFTGIYNFLQVEVDFAHRLSLREGSPSSVCFSLHQLQGVQPATAAAGYSLFLVSLICLLQKKVNLGPILVLGSLFVVQTWQKQC